MTYEWTLYFCLFLALWSAVIGGVFSAFSEFIMAGLLRAEPAGGIESMQHINRTVIKTQFVSGIFFITIFSVLFALYAASNFDGYARVNLILASIVYVPSVFLMTVLGNVPMNNRLARLDPNTSEARCLLGYLWTRLDSAQSLPIVR